jgi:hypothetical protein
MMKQVFAAAMMIGLLAGCSTSKIIVSDVTRFHTVSAPSEFQGRTFAIAAVNAEQQQSIAFHSFADKINAQLSAIGMTQYTGSNGPAGADYVINLHYGVTGPTPDVRAEWAGPNWYGPHYGFGFGHWGRHAISSGLSGQIEPIMPYMIDSIFRDFPGQSGKTMTVRVEVPPDVERNAAATRRPTF